MKSIFDDMSREEVFGAFGVDNPAADVSVPEPGAVEPPAPVGGSVFDSMDQAEVFRVFGADIPEPAPTIDPGPDLDFDPTEDFDANWKDYGASFMMGAAQTGEAVLNASSWLPGGQVAEMGRDGLPWLAKKVGADNVGVAIEEFGKGAVDYWYDNISEGGKADMAKEFVKKAEEGEGFFGLELGEAAKDKDSVGLAVASSLPATIAGMGLGGGVTKVLQLFANPLGRTALVQAASQGSTQAARKLKLVDAMTGVAGFGAGEGAIAGLMSGQGVYQTVKGMDHEQLMDHPEYRKAFEATDLGDYSGSIEERVEYAKESIASKAASEAGWKAGLTTSILGAPMGAFFGRILGPAGLNRVTSSKAGDIAIGAMGEAGQEAVQSAGEQLITNQAIIENADEKQELWEGVANAVVGGSLAGGLMGGGMTLLTPQSADQDPAAQAPQEPGESPFQTEVDPGFQEAATSLIRTAMQNDIDPNLVMAIDENFGGEPSEQYLSDLEELVETGALPETYAQKQEIPIENKLIEQDSELEIGSELEAAAADAAASPENDLPEPTPAQAEAGNYKKGHFEPKGALKGLRISIENPRGSVRRGTDRDGKEWETELQHHYGDIKGTEGGDGENIDVFVSDQAENPMRPVFVVDQIDPQSGQFDEHKVMMGFRNDSEAREAYLSNYEQGWQGLGSVTRMSQRQFVNWVNQGDVSLPLSSNLKRGVKPVDQFKPMEALKVGDFRVMNDINVTISDASGVPEGFVRGAGRDTGQDISASFAPAAAESPRGVVYVGNEFDSAGKFVRPRAFIGFESRGAAFEAAGAASNDIAGLTAMSAGKFRSWVASGSKSKPVETAGRSRQLDDEQFKKEVLKPIEDTIDEMLKSRSPTKKFASGNRVVTVRPDSDTFWTILSTIGGVNMDRLNSLGGVSYKDMQAVNNLQFGTPFRRQGGLDPETAGESLRGLVNQMGIDQSMLEFDSYDRASENSMLDFLGDAVRGLVDVRFEEARIKEQQLEAAEEAIRDAVQQREYEQAADNAFPEYDDEYIDRQRPEDLGPEFAELDGEALLLSQWVEEALAAGVINEEQADEIVRELDDQADASVSQVVRRLANLIDFYGEIDNETVSESSSGTREAESQAAEREAAEPSINQETPEPESQSAENETVSDEVLASYDYQEIEEKARREAAEEAAEPDTDPDQADGGLFDEGPSNEELFSPSQAPRLSTAPSSTFEAAVSQMLQDQTGEAEGALYNPELGAIDLIWGEEGSAERNYADGFGLSKILKKHPEVNPMDLEEIMIQARVVRRDGNRVQLETEKHRLAVRLDWEGERRKWLLTAFEVDPAPGARTTDVDSGAGPETTPSNRAGESSIAPTPSDGMSVTGVFDALEAMNGLDAGSFTVVRSADQLQEVEGLQRLMTVWHGSPGRFDQFDMGMIGQGEGTQVFGYGLYLASQRAVAEHYRNHGRNAALRYEGELMDRQAGEDSFDAAVYAVSRARGNKVAAKRSQTAAPELIDLVNPELIEPEGQVYEVDVSDDRVANMLDWDAPLGQQSEAVRRAVYDAANGIDQQDLDSRTGGDIYDSILVPMYGSDRNQQPASEALLESGVPGIKYLDGASRSAGEGSRNYVVFDSSDAVIRQRLSTEGQAVEGMFDPGTGQVYLVADNIRSADRAKWVAWHEQWHRGANVTFGSQFNQILKTAGKNKFVADLAAAIQEDRGEANELISVEEALAELNAAVRTEDYSHIEDRYGLDVPRGMRGGWRAALNRFLDKLRGLLSRILGRDVTTNSEAMGILLSVDMGVTSEDVVAQSAPRRSVVAAIQPQETPWALKKKTRRQALKKHWDKWFRAKGNLPQDVFEEKVIKDSRAGEVELHIGQMLVDVNRAIKAVYKKRYDQLNVETKEKLSAYMVDESVDLPGPLAEAMDTMRSYIDTLSIETMRSGMYRTHRIEYQIVDSQGAVLDEGFRNRPDAEQRLGSGLFAGSNPEIVQVPVPTDLHKRISENMGRYLNRSYQAFDDPEWPTKVSDKARENAFNYIKRQWSIDGRIQRLEGQGLTPQQIDERVAGTVNNILEDGTAADNIGAFISESRLGAKDLTMLMKRKDIARPIRELLGEYTDPRLNFARTATKMQRALLNHKFLRGVRESGVGEFLFDEPQGEYSVPIATEGSANMDPLSGLYTTPEIRDAFREALDKQPLSDFYRFFIKWNGFIKYGKTVLSPTTIARNFMSAFFFSVANGHARSMNPLALGQATRLVVAQMNKGGTEEHRAYLRKMKRLGVTLDNVYAGEMLQLIEDVSNSDVPLTGGREKVRHFFHVMTMIYQSGDDFWKIIGFENEKASIIRHRGASEIAAEVEAAQRIRDTYPTYSLVGRGIKWLRRFPLVGTFVSFPAEIVRTSGNIIRMTASDFSQADTRPMAVRRMVGVSIATGLAAAAASLSRVMLGLDDDDDEAVRRMAPPWQRNSDLLYLGYNDKGHLEYLDLSFLDPYNYLKRPFNAMFTGGTWKEKVVSASKDLVSPFLGPDIAATALGEILFNQKAGTRARVYNPEDSIPKIVTSSLNHLRKSVQPGFMSNTERLIQAYSGNVSRSGKQYEVDDEALALVGFRKTTLNAPQALSYKGFDFQERKRNATRILSYPLGSQNRMSDREVTEYFNQMMRAREMAYRDMISFSQTAEALGMSKMEVSKVLRSSGVAKSDVRMISRGNAPRWKMSSSFLKSARERALSTAESPERRRELLKEFNGRRQLVLDLAREYYAD